MSERKFKDVKDGKIAYIRAKQLFEDKVDGEVLQGTFVGTTPNSYDEKKDDFKFEKEDGSIVIVNGSGNLNFSMKFVDVGEYVQICYHGMQKIAKGKMEGKMSHNFSVNREDV